MSTQSKRKATLAIHAGGLEETIFGEVSVPIFQSSTFSFHNADDGAARIPFPHKAKKAGQIRHCA